MYKCQCCANIHTESRFQTRKKKSKLKLGIPRDSPENCQQIFQCDTGSDHWQLSIELLYFIHRAFNFPITRFSWRDRPKLFFCFSLFFSSLRPQLNLASWSHGLSYWFFPPCYYRQAESTSFYPSTRAVLPSGRPAVVAVHCSKGLRSSRGGKSTRPNLYPNQP